MSSISSPTEGSNLNYYQKELARLEEDNRNEARQNRVQSEKRVEDLEDRYKKALVKKDEEIEATVNAIRNSSQDSLLKEKERYQESLGQIRDSRYNHRGLSESGSARGTGELEDYYHEGFDKLREQLDQEKEKHRLSQNETSERLQKGYEASLSKKNDEIEQNMTRLRAQTQGVNESEREKHQKELDALKSQNYNQKGLLAQSIPVSAYQRELQEMQDRSDRRHQMDIQSEEEIKAAQKVQLDHMAREGHEQLEAMKTRYGQEVQDLHGKLADLSTAHLIEEKKNAETSARLVRDYENANRSEALRSREAYEAVISKLRENNTDKDALLAGRTNEILKEKDQHWASIIEKQNRDQFATSKQLQDEFANQVQELNRGKRQELQKSDDQISQLVSKANEQKNAALTEQAKSYEKSMKQERKKSGEEIESLQRSLQTQKTSQDTAVVSPAAEAAIRSSLTREYDKVLNAEIDRNKSNLDLIQQKQAENYRKLIDEWSEKEEQFYRQNASEKEADLSQYHESLADFEEVSKTQFLNQSRDHERQREALIRNFSNMMEQQRREYEHILAVGREESGEKLSSIQRDSAFNAKIVQRSFTKEKNEIIREYERKLADQQADFEKKQEELKSQSQIGMRDVERRSKQDLEVLSKNYEQKLVQLEVQHKERERYLEQNFQDEIDRTKRSYEFLNKKKS